MTFTVHKMIPAFAAALALSACGNAAEDTATTPDTQLAEDAADGTVADEMNSGAPEIRDGGGMAVDGADNPNEPVVPESAPTPAESEAAEVTQGE